MKERKNDKLPNQDLLNHQPLTVLSLGEYSSELSEVPHSHDAYMLMVVQETKGGDNLIDFRRYALQAGRLFFVRPGQAHQRQARQEQGILVSFSEEFLQTTGTNAHDVLVLFGSLYQHPYLDLPPQLLHTVEQLAHLMELELQKPLPDWAILSRYLYILLRYLLLESVQIIKQLTPPRHSERLFQLSHLVEEYFREHRPITFYADALAITPKHLNSLCRKYLNTTVADMQHERLLLESKRLLYFSSLSVKEIAFELGFEDASYFVRFFKRLTSTTPMQFRVGGSKSTTLAAENPAT
ncbi:helix-turn-helix domain-containing protein [Pontibacter qinzhouensis]|uniref:Helix-turn-helix domain-containing protein n=1 Tax=Pontibacter qinzhouensis TaxID=2603253 RepID=A0A5C8KAT8_9BACT|nr:helix-turn-helix transcriptional regulator [Pontibacter qinzhouensis]TXK46802.1 helix-turn-helix domain-containing protein [Pontibacter qinzhouensis]